VVDLFPPFGVVLFSGNEGFAPSFDAVAPSIGGLTHPFPPFGIGLLSGGKGFGVGCGAVTAGIASEGAPAVAPSPAEVPFAEAV
jgi:hypothetical protein